MNGIARISFSGGERLMPARTRDDREQVFEEAEFCARRHGGARLELNRAALQIRVNPSAGGLVCAVCAETADHLAFVVGERALCRRCACDAA